MKTALTVVLVVVVSTFLMSCMIGCLTPEQQRRITESAVKLAEKTKELEKYEDKLAEILDKVNDGTYTVGEGRLFRDEIKEDIKETTEAAVGFKDTIDKIRAEGGGGLDIATGILLSIGQILANLGIIRFWRGGVNNRAGDIGVRTPPA